MKTIPQTVAANKGATGYSIRVALLVEFDSGDYCFTSDGWDPGFDDCTLRDRVESWGACSALLEGSDPKAFAQASLSLTVGDPTGELRDLFQDHQFQRTKCALYWAIFTPGEAEPTYAQAVLVLRGLLVPPVVWREGDRTVGMGVTDLAEANEVLVGARCTLDEFQWLAKENEGKEVPIIYGRADRVSPVHLNRGPMAHVTGRVVDSADTEIIVDDAERFPQETPIQIEIGHEVISGSFVGNRFVVTSRGDDIYNGTTTGASAGSCTIIDTGLAAFTSGRLTGYHVKVDLPPNSYTSWNYQYHYTAVLALSMRRDRMFSVPAPNLQTRLIIRNTDNQLEFETPFEVVGVQGTVSTGIGASLDGHQVGIRAGGAYVVGTIATAHQIGDEVLRYMGVANELEYAVSMGACTIRQVYVHGHIYKYRSFVEKADVTIFGGGLDYMKRMAEWSNEEATAGKDDWIPIPSDMWHVDAATVQGKVVTRIYIARYPTQMASFICDTDDILVDVDGPTGGDDEMIRNPAEVIEHMHALYADLPSARGLEGWWRLDDANDSTIAEDSSGNDHDGAVGGNVDFYPNRGRIDGAADFPGAVGDDITVPNDAALQAACSGAFSVALWFRLDGHAGDDGIITKKVLWNDAAGFDIVAQTAIFYITGNGTSFARTSNVVFDRDWHHLCVVFSGTTATAYLDATPTGMADASVATALGGTSDLVLGVSRDIGARLNGMLDDTRIYDRMLSAAEVAALYSGARQNTDFTDAVASLANWEMGFERQTVTPLREITADLAFQARCRIRWLGDAPELLYQGVDGGSADLAIAANQVIMHSSESDRDELELSATRVTARWREDGFDKSLEETDDDAEDDVGERRVDIDCWAYQREECPRALARYLLESYKRLHERGRMGVTVHAVGLEPGDIVDVDADLDDAIAFAPVKGRVTEVSHDPGLEPDALPREDVAIRFFRWPGCRTSCEGACETTGCEAACETYYEPSIECWRCETSCQTACEFYCESGYELFCSDHACESSLVIGCVALCQALEMIISCGACEADSCQSADCQLCGGEAEA